MDIWIVYDSLIFYIIETIIKTNPASFEAGFVFYRAYFDFLISG